MSVMGTGLAAGVAATALNAQQAAREKDKQEREARRATERGRDRYEGQMKVMEEEEGDATPRLAVDDQMQDRHAVQAQGGKRGSGHASVGGEAAAKDGERSRLDVTA